MPIVPDLAVQPGDQVELIGAKEQVDAAGQWLGCREGSGLETSVVLVAAAIAIGIVVGLLEVRLGGVPLALSVSGGVLVLGLVVGWLRERCPRLGNVPPASLWLMQALGLDLFIAMVGLTSSAGFVVGLQRMGVQLFLAGVVVSLVPVVVGLAAGAFRVPVPSGDHPGRHVRRAHGARLPRRGAGRAPERHARAGVHRALRRGQHRLRHLGRPDGGGLGLRKE